MLKLVAAIVATRRHGRRESGRPDIIYLAHSAKESSTPADKASETADQYCRAGRPNHGRHRPGIGRGDESRCRRRSGDHPLAIAGLQARGIGLIILGE